MLIFDDRTNLVIVIGDLVWRSGLDIGNDTHL